MDSVFYRLGAYLQSDGAGLAATFCTIWRYVAPLLAILLLWRCAKPMLRFRREPETWAWLVMPDGQQLPITHWENIIGRAKSSDIIVNFPTISRNHAVLTRYDDGSWSITEIGSRGSVLVNGKKTSVSAVNYGDVISLGGVEVMLAPTTAEELEEQQYTRTRPNEVSMPSLTLLLLTLFQLLTVVQLWTSCKPENAASVALSFGVLIGLQWLLFCLLRLMRRSGFDVETLAFFLTTIGLAVIASSDASALMKQVICVAGGIVIYLIVSWSLRDLNRAKAFRYLAAIAGIGLLAVNLVFGRESNGAKNWIDFGFFSFQPSELVKICFLYVCASTMDRIVSKRNIITFIAYSVVICGFLALMSDFGTALIFFVAFLVIAYLRSGSFATIGLACTATGFAGAVAASLKPYILRRFSGWGHVWEHPYDSLGYQQTRAMMCIASGGLLGLGAGNGWLKYVAAADTDLVFAFVSEEWGLMIGIVLVCAIVVLSVFVLRSCAVGRSSFYTIGACAAVAIFMTQTILNVFGTMDLLPLTGVTFPFLSNGGSSMLSSWGLLAFIKAADTRQNASLAVKTVQPEEVDEDE